MNSSYSGLSQPDVENFVLLADRLNLFAAMDEMEVTVPAISKNEELYNYLMNNLRWEQVLLLQRLVLVYRTTGEIPRFGFQQRLF